MRAGISLEKGDEMSGIVKADISAAGRMSSIDKKEYDKFKMAGSLEIDKMNYKTTTLPYAVMLNTMKLNFTNQFVELAAFDALMGKSDVRANGKIENFMQYIFKDSLIKGAFNVQSNLMDLNELMASSGPTTAAQPAAADTAAMTVAEVPGNIDFNLKQQRLIKCCLLAFLLIAFVSITYSQNSPTENTYTTSTTFNPTIKDAIKFSDLPEIKDSVKRIQNIKYGIYSEPLFPKYQVQLINAAKIQNEPLPKLYHALIKAGYGPIYNMPYGEIFLANTRSRQNNYGLHFKHLSNTAHLENVGYGGMSNNKLNVFAKQFYKKHTLSGNILYPIMVVGSPKNADTLLKGIASHYNKTYKCKVTVLNSYDGDPYFKTKKSMLKDDYLFLIICNDVKKLNDMKEKSKGLDGNVKLFIDIPLL